MTYEQIQHLLAYLGYYRDKVDGIWGMGSKNATECFQRDYGLTVDGIAGAITQKALRGAVAGTTDKVKVDDFWTEIKYFKKEEFACKCGMYHDPYCNGYPAEMREEVVRIADRLREHFGTPATIVSGLRCRQHNIDCGGVSNSQHQYGEACDIMLEGVGADELLNWIYQQKGVRYAYKINATNVHFDIPQGAR